MTIAVFRSYVADEHREEHDRLYDQMHGLVQQSPGYISHKLFSAADGETVVIAEFTDIDSVETWVRIPTTRSPRRPARAMCTRHTTSQCARSSNGT